MKARGKPIAIALLCLAGGVGIVWLVIVLPPWIREERTIARLKSADIEEVKKAAETLGEMGSVKAIPTILEIMGRRASESNSNDYRFNYMDSLKSIIEKRGYEAVSPLVSKLNSSDRNIKSAACELLGDIGTEARIAIPQLSELLKDPLARVAAAKALFEVGAESESYIPPLIQFSRDQEDWVRMEALWILSTIIFDQRRWDLNSEWLQSLKSESSEHQILLAMDWLGSYGESASAAIPWAMQKANDSGIHVRRVALKLLGAIGTNHEEVQRLLIAALSDQDEICRAAAAIGLYKIGPRAASALPSLKRLLKSDPDEAVRASAAFGVLKLEPENQLAAKMVKVAQDSIMKGATLWLHQNEAFGRDSSKAALLSIGIQDRELRVFIDALKDPDLICRAKALTVLELLGRSAKPALSQIIEATSDPNRIIRAQAVGALGAIGPDAAATVPILNEALKTRNAYIRYQARRALSLIQKDQPAR